MDAGTPKPAIYSDDSGLTCAYIIGASHAESGSTAILHFDSVLYHAFGYPNDEALSGHALYGCGLEHYQFHVINGSPLIEDFDQRNRIHKRHEPGAFQKRFRHWIITFHDETLEVLARNARLLRITKSRPGVAVRERSDAE